MTLSRKIGREPLAPARALSVGLSRRQVIRGVSGAAATSLLVNVPTRETQARVTLPPGFAIEDTLWLVGAVPGEGYVAQAIGPDASDAGAIRGIHHAVARSVDGRSIFDVSATAQGRTLLRVYSADSRKISSRIEGAFEWPAEPDLDISVSASGTSVLVTGICYVGRSPKYVVKHAPGAPRQAITSMTWQALAATEVFDMNTGRVGSFADPAEVQLGAQIRGAHLSDEIIELTNGHAGSRISSSPATSVASRVSRTRSDDLQLVHVSPAGHAFFLTSGHDLMIRQPGGRMAEARLPLDVRDVRAKPYPVSVVNTSATTVAVVDASRQFLATVDATTGGVSAVRRLSTAPVAASGGNPVGAAVAVDRQRRRLYVLDKSGVSGGVWIHDADTLEVLDRWYSSVPFGLVWVAPASGVVFLQTAEGPVGVHDPGGALIAFVPSELGCARAI